MRIDVNKHWRVYLDFGRAGSLSLQLYCTYYRLLHMHVAVKSHALPVYKKNRIFSLLCIFESTIKMIDLHLLIIFHKVTNHVVSMIEFTDFVNQSNHSKLS